MVEGSSMEPTLSGHQYLLVSRIAYRLRAPSRGDIVVFKDPLLSHQTDVKRIVALPNEGIRLAEGRLFINGHPLQETYLHPHVPPPLEGEGEWSLANDEFFVLGDNRRHSRDSRTFGPLPRSLIIGKVWFRYWPPEAWGTIP